MTTRPHAYDPDRSSHMALIGTNPPCRACSQVPGHRMHQPRWWRILHPLAKWR